MPAAALLEATDLSVGYGGDPVCAPVTLSVAAGSAVALVGPNGAGKSTVLQTLVGLLPPLAGAVRFAGVPVDERAAASPMGAVPVGVGSTLVRGPDVGVLGTAPVALALLLGTVPWWLVGAQLVWSAALAAFAVLTAQRS